MQSLADKGALKADLDVDAAGGHPLERSITRRLYRLLAAERGWSPERYEQWMTDLLCTQLLGDDPHAVVAGSADAS